MRLGPWTICRRKLKQTAGASATSLYWHEGWAGDRQLFIIWPLWYSGLLKLGASNVRNPVHSLTAQRSFSPTDHHFISIHMRFEWHWPQICFSLLYSFRNMFCCKNKGVSSSVYQVYFSYCQKISSKDQTNNKLIQLTSIDCVSKAWHGSSSLHLSNN